MMGAWRRTFDMGAEVNSAHDAVAELLVNDGLDRERVDDEHLVQPEEFGPDSQPLRRRHAV